MISVYQYQVTLWKIKLASISHPHLHFEIIPSWASNSSMLNDYINTVKKCYVTNPVKMRITLLITRGEFNKTPLHIQWKNENSTSPKMILTWNKGQNK